MANIGGNLMNPWLRILRLPITNGLLGCWMSGQRSGQFPEDGKLSLKEDAPQVCQQHEDVERKYYHIIIFPGGLERRG